jgi:hypothetical protein
LATGTRGIVGEFRCTLTENAIQQSWDESKSEQTWRMIERVVTTPLRTFLFITPTCAILWPRHGFRTEDEYEKVVAFAKERFAHFHGPQ